MLIDEFLPAYDVQACYHIDVHAPIEQAYHAARFLDTGCSWVVRWLFRLRGLPMQALTLDGMLKFGFILLGETPPQEILFGLVGRFWTRSGQIQHLDSENFARFDQEGFAKVAANISLSRQPGEITRVTTETRVQCLGRASQSYFRLYWLPIGPFSGIIRKEWLRIIKRQAENLSR